jgi:hypothetical protein
LHVPKLRREGDWCSPIPIVSVPGVRSEGMDDAGTP